MIVTLTRLPKSSGLTPTRWIRPSRQVKARLVTASVTRLSYRADRSDTLLYTIFSSSFIAGIHLVNQINHSNSLLLNQRNKRKIKAKDLKTEGESYKTPIKKREEAINKDIRPEIVKKEHLEPLKEREEAIQNKNRPEKVKKELLEPLEQREEVINKELNRR